MKNTYRIVRSDVLHKLGRRFDYLFTAFGTREKPTNFIIHIIVEQALPFEKPKAKSCL